MDVVLKAGARHFANYQAFAYGRAAVVRVLRGEEQDEENSQELGEEKARARKEMGKRLVSRVREWCLKRPRDISGWAFLAFLLRQFGNEERANEKEVRAGQTADRHLDARDETEYVRAWAESIGWEGAAVCWFLKYAAGRGTGDGSSLRC